MSFWLVNCYSQRENKRERERERERQRESKRQRVTEREKEEKERMIGDLKHDGVILIPNTSHTNARNSVKEGESLEVEGGKKKGVE